LAASARRCCGSSSTGSICRPGATTGTSSGVAPDIRPSTRSSPTLPMVAPTPTARPRRPDQGRRSARDARRARNGWRCGRTRMKVMWRGIVRRQFGRW
jgi:hypothetical protein